MWRIRCTQIAVSVSYVIGEWGAMVRGGGRRRGEKLCVDIVRLTLGLRQHRDSCWWHVWIHHRHARRWSPLKVLREVRDGEMASRTFSHIVLRRRGLMLLLQKLEALLLFLQLLKMLQLLHNAHLGKFGDIASRS